MEISKSTVLQEIARARLAHIRWVNRADHLISGLPVDKEFIPLIPTECGFGKWFYGPVGHELRIHEEFKHLMEQIELYHDDLHKVYSEIYRIFFVIPKQRSLIQKLLFTGKKVPEKEKERAKELFRSLQNASDKLVTLLDKLESQVKTAETLSVKQHIKLRRA